MRYRVSNETWYLGDDLKIVFDILNLFMAFSLKIFHYFCKNNTFKTDCRMKAVNFLKKTIVKFICHILWDTL